MTEEERIEYTNKINREVDLFINDDCKHCFSTGEDKHRCASCCLCGKYIGNYYNEEKLKESLRILVFNFIDKEKFESSKMAYRHGSMHTIKDIEEWYKPNDTFIGYRIDTDEFSEFLEKLKKDVEK